MNAQQLMDWAPPVLYGVVALMSVLERLSPLQKLEKFSIRHVLVNVGLSFVTGIPSLLGLALLLATSAWATEHRFGLLNLFDFPLPVRLVVALVSIDFADWLRHLSNHKVPWFWRLHRVHHMDPHADATTSLRAHPFEHAIAYPYFALVVLLVGLDPLCLAVRTIITSIVLAWHHSAFKLPLWLDQAISLITPTPRSHRQHHSRDVTFTDTNYGTMFTWWDRAFGTWSPVTKWKAEKTGLDGFDSPERQRLWWQLRSFTQEPQTTPLSPESQKA
jgi:sterol desaturase/sphingolipid hydroxylase (fatty acid hydroxylase superfamily)